MSKELSLGEFGAGSDDGLEHFPDELESAAAARKVSLPADNIEPDPRLPPRIYVPETIQGLAADIEENGLAHDLVVRPPAGPGDPWRLVVGRRRFRALTQHLGWENIPVKVREDLRDDDVGALKLAIAENNNREGEPLLQEAWNVSYLASLLKSEGETAITEALAVCRGRAAGGISVYRQIGDAIPPAKLAEWEVPLEDLADARLSDLKKISKVEESSRRQATRILAGLEDPPEPEEDEGPPQFEFRPHRRGGGWVSRARCSLDEMEEHNLEVILEHLEPIVEETAARLGRRVASGADGRHELAALIRRRRRHYGRRMRELEERVGDLQRAKDEAVALAVAEASRLYARELAEEEVRHRAETVALERQLLGATGGQQRITGLLMTLKRWLGFKGQTVSPVETSLSTDEN